MKIEIEIPDWAEERSLNILAGIELVAKKYPDQEWQVKTSRCSQCGKCCMKLDCEHLRKDGNKYECDYRAARPWSCCVGQSGIKGCTEVLEYVK